MTISHEFFGELNLDNNYEIWQKDMAINGKVTDVFLTNDSDQSPSQTTLDKFAEICQNLDEFDKQNREYLVEYLNEYSGFIDCYLSEPESYEDDSETLANFYQGDQSTESFVNLLQIDSLILNLDEEDGFISTDYMIDPDVSDQVLCVRREINGSLIGIVWES